VHVDFSSVRVVSRLLQDKVSEFTILDDVGEHLSCLFMAFDKSDADVVGKRKVREQVLSEELA